MKIRLTEDMNVPKYRVDIVTDRNNPKVYVYRNGTYVYLPNDQIEPELLQKLLPLNPFQQPDFNSRDWKQHRKEMEKDATRSETQEERDAEMKKLGDYLSGKTQDDLKKEFGKGKKYKGAMGDPNAKRYDDTLGITIGYSEETLKRELKNFIGGQCKKYKVIRQSSWNKFNKKAMAAGIIKPGIKKTTEKINQDKPSINIYFDHSGSWGEEDIKKGEEFINVLRGFEEDGLLDIHEFYFADTLSDNPQEATGGNTNNVKLVVQHILQNQPMNAIILTDSDFAWDYVPENKNAPSVSLPGGVWFVFRNGSIPTTVVKHKPIKGKYTAYFDLKW